MTDGEEHLLDPEVLRALRNVIDPELGLDVVALGLIYAAQRQGDAVHVVMTMTTPTCPLGEALVADARAAIADALQVKDVEVQLVFEPPWTPARLSPEARAALGHSDEETVR